VNQPAITQTRRPGATTRPGDVTRGQPVCTQGFSLVEVLVAVLVLTSGLLGLAALQVTGLKATGSAQLSTLASLAAYDAIDRLRADPLSVPKSGAKLAVPANRCDASVGQSTAINLWQEGACAFGLAQSSAQANALLIDCGATKCGTDNCEVTVYWDDSRVGAGDRSFSVCTRFPVR